ncbi:MAG: penicillin amidase, partial [Bacteriovoracaceae bacterium]
MKKKIIVAIASLTLFLAMGICLFIFNALNKVVPQVEGELLIKGLAKEVKVYRDEKGIPHIEAEDELDMYMALGYIHASERLFQ